MLGTAKGIPTLVAVEAKAGEPFGDQTVGQRVAAVAETPRSGVPRRVAGLIEAVTGERPEFANGAAVPTPLADRGYQLLTATVGTVIEAARRHCTRAVLLVHEFASQNPRPKVAKDLADARADLDAFLGLLSGDASAPLRPAITGGEFS